MVSATVLFKRGDRVLTSRGLGLVSFVRMAPPDYRWPQAVCVVLDDQKNPRGTMFSAEDIHKV